MMAALVAMASWWTPGPRFAIRGVALQNSWARCSILRCASSGYFREEGDAGAVDEAVVERLLVQRNDARAGRDWKVADGLRDELRRIGVTVHDNERVWFVDRSRGYGSHPSPSVDDYDRGGRAPRYRDDGYDRAGKAPRYRDDGYDSGGRAPRYRDDGYDLGGRAPKYGQSSPDQWRQSRRERDARRMAARARPYERAQDCEANLTPEEIQEIESQVAKRLQKKLDRRFAEADELLADLEARGVAVSDDARQWRADDNAFVYEYAQEGGVAGRTAGELAHVRQLIHERGIAKSRRMYERSDELLEMLYDLGVDCDDDRRTWCFTYMKEGRGGSGRMRDGQRAASSHHDYRRASADDFELSSSRCDEIDALLGRRLAAKKARDFQRADALQTELRALGIEVDDRRREWYVRYHEGRRSASSWTVRGG